MITEKQINDLVNGLSRIADGVEDLNDTLDGSFGTGTFYDGKMIDGLMEVARSINPKRFENPKKKK